MVLSIIQNRNGGNVVVTYEKMVKLVGISSVEKERILFP